MDWLVGMGQPDNNEAISNIKELAKLCACSHNPENSIALKISVSKLICSMKTDRDFRLVCEYDPELKELEIHGEKNVGYDTRFDAGEMASEDIKTLLDWIAYVDQSAVGKSEKTGMVLSNLKYPSVAKKLQMWVNTIPDLIWSKKAFQMVFIFDSGISELKIDVKYDPKKFLK